jgi:hypothetical protein
MSRIALGALTTLNLSTQLDSMFTELYELRDFVTTPGYTAGLPYITFAGGLVGVSMTPVARLDVNGNGRFSGSNAIVTSLSAFAAGITGAFPHCSWVCASAATDYKSWDCYADTTTFNYRVVNDANSGAGIWMTVTRSGITPVSIAVAGVFKPLTDNTQTLGAAANRWSTVYAGTGTINTSDAREKTAVVPLGGAELAAARELAREVGSFQFLGALADKGVAARRHVGLTVQRAMQVLAAQGLDPMRYAFICHDTWPAHEVAHPAEQVPHPTMVDDAGQPLMVETAAPWVERVPAGDRYGFRADELLLFIARGFEARLAALEARG